MARLVLPKTFLGLPLYIGVETVLGFAALNKASGFYGIISIFTGHPIGFLQAIFNICSILMFPIYIMGLKAITRLHPESRVNVTGRLALVTLTYLFDSALSVLFTLYFAHFWFANEDTQATHPVTDSTTDTSQSATPAYELFLTVSTTVILNAARFYFSLVMLSYTKGLTKVARSQGRRKERKLSGKFPPADEAKWYAERFYQMEDKSLDVIQNVFKYV
ncbi:hypothetical protein BABINDRAFT_6267 [Babjeviella inositovora NRRL Y-12698]|uniref:DUF1753-domain-containing protein n=1 Tax=Babjeviella inositovora NRRL Y-12698 TaxID=984486 RepID=A0A1E3QX54_9ASCO|nr:uncharacterized protein BABINDRAFT_6267 [Babjeviella inositovora NRRL Y-12698]ODQ81587.1 hypothetical protein BABINDRAFT_6267 [Babjeviella inositovora NRRL Y-12698]